MINTIRILVLVVFSLALIAAVRGRRAQAPDRLMLPSTDMQEPGKFWLADDRLYVIVPGRELRIYNIADLANPALSATIPATNTSELAVLPTDDGHVVYMDNAGSLDIYRIAPGSAPLLVRSLAGVCDVTQYPTGDWEYDEDAYGCGSCYQSDTVGNFSSGSTGGSLARFAVAGDYLYTLRSGRIKVFQLRGGIASPVDPLSLGEYSTAWDIETIHSALGNLFMGAASGVHVYSLSNPEAPVRIGGLTHVRARDPIVVEEPYAYVTLRDGNFSDGGPLSRLEVLRLNDLTNMERIRTIGVGAPYGLAAKSGYVYVCDRENGVLVYSQPATNTLAGPGAKIGGIDPRDAIIRDSTLLVNGRGEVLLYSIAEPLQPVLLSKIVIE
ncbi:MAG TPA: hypothetical protein PK297_03440 [Spirochaetota bacterium]|nr:hypothetical protein [Spirochaetota bacterium]